MNSIPTFILDNKSYITAKESVPLIKNLNENSFSTICINIMFLLNLNNFNILKCLLSALKINPHLFEVNETWEKPNTIGQHRKLNEYIYLSNPRQQHKEGGVAMYIKKYHI